MFLPALHHHMHHHCNPYSYNMGCGMNPYMSYMAGSMLGLSLFSMASNLCGNFPSYTFNPFCTMYSNPFMNNNPFLFMNSGLYAGINNYVPAFRPVFQYYPQINGFGNYNFSYSAPNTATLTKKRKTKTSGSDDSPADNNPTDKIHKSGKLLRKDKKLYGKEFLNKVKKIANKLNCNYRDLLGVMNSESGINASAKNPHGSATGLIQFVESTARSLGTSTAALANMTPVEQLDYVEKYLLRAKASAGFSSKDKLSAGELYALVFLPARAKREVLTSSGENYYSANKVLDTNKDGKITKQELGQKVKSRYVSDMSFLA